MKEGLYRHLRAMKMPIKYGNSCSVFNPPEQYEVMLLAENMDVTCSSGIHGINSRICKCIMLHIPGKID